jgi:hypothetical protein
MEIPDDWELVEHTGVQVLKIGNRYVDFDIAPLATTSTDADATWDDEDQQLTEEILNTVTGLDAQMEISYVQ